MCVFLTFNSNLIVATFGRRNVELEQAGVLLNLGSLPYDHVAGLDPSIVLAGVERAVVRDRGVGLLDLLQGGPSEFP